MASGAAGQVMDRSKAAAGKYNIVLLVNILLVFLSIIAIMFMSFFTSTRTDDIMESIGPVSSLKDLKDLEVPSSVGLHLFFDVGFGSNFIKVIFFLAPSILALVMMILPFFGKSKLSAWNFVPFVVVGILYVLIELVMLGASTESSRYSIAFGAWLFLLCTIGAVVLSFILLISASKNKRQKQMEAMARAYAQNGNMNMNNMNMNNMNMNNMNGNFNNMNGNFNNNNFNNNNNNFNNNNNNFNNNNNGSVG